MSITLTALVALEHERGRWRREDREIRAAYHGTLACTSHMATLGAR